MSPPDNLFLTRTRSGRLRLHAGNSINSVGKGPAELRGRRETRWTMSAKQVIYRKDGTKLRLNTGARLGFKAIPGQYRYWKFIHAARFELWKLDRAGGARSSSRWGRRCPTACATSSGATRSSRARPAASTTRRAARTSRRRRVTLGTSVGWSDVYPSTYHEQWINVSNRRGCFAYVHVADPKNGIYESNENNNEGETIVRLPWRGAGLRGCPGESRSGGPDGGAEAPASGDPYYR